MSRTGIFWLVILVLVIIVLAVQRGPDTPTVSAGSDSLPFVRTGERALTVQGYVACTSEEALDRVLELVGQDDREAAQKAIDARGSGCLVLAGGDTVVKSGAAMFRVRIRVPGEPQELHTVSEAIRPLR